MTADIEWLKAQVKHLLRIQGELEDRIKTLEARQRHISAVGKLLDPQKGEVETSG